MVLESTMLCLDNSEYMRNGDYTPSRISAQKDAASVLCNEKVHSNPENTVGLLTMAGREGIELLVSPTQDIAKILAAFSRMNIGGQSDFSSAVQIAQLALKHRKNKNGGQRIIAFVGSPISDDVNNLKKIGKQLKKNNVAIDVVSMGEIDDNHEKLLEFINATNSNDNCRLITVPAGVLPADALQTSRSIEGGAENTGGAGGGFEGGFDEYGGIDPSMDPELAMAIRVSTEEARAREEARSGPGATASTASASSGVPASAMDDDDEEALMQRALALSMQDSNPTPAVEQQGGSTLPVSSAGDAYEEEEEDAELMEAMRLSMQTSEAPLVHVSEEVERIEANIKKNGPPPVVSGGNSGGNAGGAVPFMDAEFVKELLGGADLDMNDPLVQAALAQLGSAPSAASSDESSDAKRRKTDEEDEEKK